MRNPVALGVAALMLAACAGGQGGTSPNRLALFAGKVAVIEQHPFDLEERLLTQSSLEASDLIDFMQTSNATTVGTDYDKMHSIMALLDGPFQEGDKIVFDYRQYVSGKWYDYARTFTIEHDPTGSAVLIIGSYRITRNASVYLEIKVKGGVVAEHHFNVAGPNHRFGVPYSIEPGSKKLSAQEARVTLSGGTFRQDEGGFLTFNEDGSYFYKGERHSREGTWEVEADGKACISFPDGRRPCVVLYRDRDGNLKYSNDGARKFRLRKEA